MRIVVVVEHVQQRRAIADRIGNRRRAAAVAVVGDEPHCWHFVVGTIAAARVEDVAAVDGPQPVAAAVADAAADGQQADDGVVAVAVDGDVDVDGNLVEEQKWPWQRKKWPIAGDVAAVVDSVDGRWPLLPA